VGDADLATGLLGQLLGILQPDLGKSVDAATINQVLAKIQGVRPADALEAMFAVMLVAAQHAALDSVRRAAHPGQTPSGRQSYTALGLKAMRTCAQLVEALNHSRGKSVTQRFIIERVNVEAGGQAVVGAIDARKGAIEKSG
jgi:hypothetical protein